MMHTRFAGTAALLTAAGVLALRAAVGCGGSSFSAAPGDGGGSGDAAGDDGGTGDAAAGGSFCAQAEHAGVTFCEDFDGVSTMNDLQDKWNGFVLGNGVLSLVPGLHSPHALAATAGNNDRASLVHAPFEMQPKASIRLEYDLRVDSQQVQPFNGAALTEIVLGSDPNKDATVYLYIGYLTSVTLELAWTDPADAGQMFHSNSVNYAPPSGTWDGRWAIQIGMADGSLSVTHDMVTVLTSSQKLSAAALQPSAVTVNAGLTHNTGNTSTVAIAMDNLVLDVK